MLRGKRGKHDYVPEIDMRLQRAKPRPFKELARRDIIGLGVNHNDAATVFNHQVMECVKETFAHPKALHFGCDAQPDCREVEKRGKEKEKEEM